ncbi:MAG: DUF2628 domain-containing protein [Granulosicoccus sp.]|nr:DUF2628 domain-containing protein [Granulosicoccus sp.]
MIEEELYKLATEELNGPNRRPDLWKRAVALATDDHDEARYLYTNLRVEEMIEEREQNPGSAVGGMPSIDPPMVNTDPSSTTTPLPELDEKSIINSELGIDELSDDLQYHRVANDSFLDDNAADSLETLDATPLLQRSEFDDVLSDSGEMVDDDPTLRIDSLHEDALPRSMPDFKSSSNTTDVIRIPAAEEIPSFEEASQTSMFATGRTAHPDGLQDDAIFEEDNPEIDLDERANQTQDITRQLDDTLDSTWTAGLGEGAVAISAAGGVTGTGRKRFAILSDDTGQIKAVKDGVSWPAMLFTLPWLLTKKLWGTAIVYLILLAVVVLGGIAIALHIDSASEWTNPMRLVAAGFAALGFTGVFLLPFIRGNAWVAKKFQNKGYLMKGLLRANSSKHALNQIVG